MPTQPPPKAILFDIGGVVLQSPLGAILAYEKAHSIPPGFINRAISSPYPDGSWHKLERGAIPLDATFFAAFNADLRNRAVWVSHWRRSSGRDADVPPVPEIDGEDLFWRMMGASRRVDECMYPAVKRLRASGRFVIGALSNTVKFPEGHEFAKRKVDNEGVAFDEVFDVFVASADVGVRKPAREAYEIAMGELQRASVRLGRGGRLRAEEVVFLDDIGENLKAARGMGMRTIKVNLGRTREAVRELEEMTGMRPMDGDGLEKGSGAKL